MGIISQIPLNFLELTSVAIFLYTLQNLAQHNQKTPMHVFLEPP